MWIFMFGDNEVVILCLPEQLFWPHLWSEKVWLAVLTVPSLPQFSKSLTHFENWSEHLYDVLDRCRPFSYALVTSFCFISCVTHWNGILPIDLSSIILSAPKLSSSRASCACLIHWWIPSTGWSHAERCSGGECLNTLLKNFIF